MKNLITIKDIQELINSFEVGEEKKGTLETIPGFFKLYTVTKMFKQAVETGVIPAVEQLRDLQDMDFSKASTGGEFSTIRKNLRFLKKLFSDNWDENSKEGSEFVRLYQRALMTVWEQENQNDIVGEATLLLIILAPPDFLINIQHKNKIKIFTAENISSWTQQIQKNFQEPSDFFSRVQFKLLLLFNRTDFFTPEEKLGLFEALCEMVTYGTGWIFKLKNTDIIPKTQSNRVGKFFNLDKTNLSGLNFSNLDLDRICFDYSNLKNTNFKGSDLGSKNSVFFQAGFKETNFENVILDKKILFPYNELDTLQLFHLLKNNSNINSLSQHLPYCLESRNKRIYFKFEAIDTLSAYLEWKSKQAETSFFKHDITEMKNTIKAIIKHLEKLDKKIPDEILEVLEKKEHSELKKLCLQLEPLELKEQLETYLLEKKSNKNEIIKKINF